MNDNIKQAATLANTDPNAAYDKLAECTQDQDGEGGNKGGHGWGKGHGDKEDVKEASALAATDPSAAYDKLAGKLPPWLKDKGKKDDKDEDKDEDKGDKDKKEDKPVDTSKLKGGLKKWQEEQNAKKKASVEEALVLAPTDPAAAYDKLATKTVPLAEAKKGDMVEVSYRGKKFTGKVVRVKKDGVITVDPMSDDINEGAWIDFNPPKKASVEEALRLAATDPHAAYDKLAADNDALDRALGRAARTLALDVIAPLKGLSHLLDNERRFTLTATGEYEQDFKATGTVNKVLEEARKVASLLGDAMHMTEGR